MSGPGRWAGTSGRYPGGGNPNAWPMPDYFAFLALNEAAGDQTWQNVDGRFAAFESGAEPWPEDPDMATVRDVKDVAGAWWAAAAELAMPPRLSGWLVPYCLAAFEDECEMRFGTTRLYAPESRWLRFAPDRDLARPELWGAISDAGCAWLIANRKPVVSHLPWPRPDLRPEWIRRTCPARA